MNDNYPAYIAYAYQYKITHPQQREGQAFFNAALEQCSDTRGLALRIVNTSIDPFYNDNNLSDFLEYMRIAME